jgi:hypothetical protein
MHPPLAVWSPDYACDIGTHVFPTAKYAAVHAVLVASGHLPGDGPVAAAGHARTAPVGA